MSQCIWTADDDGVFETSCSNAFVFNDGGINLNGFKFCPYCGLEIEEDEPDGAIDCHCGRSKCDCGET